MYIQLLTLITNLGLAEKEAKVYLAALELGSALASQIAKKAAVDRVNTYYILDALKGRGLVSEVEKGSIKNFMAESPERLLRLGQEARQKINADLGNLRSLLPEFLSLYNTGAVRKPRVRFYEGKQGYISVYESILEDRPKELLAIMSYDDLYYHLNSKYEAGWIKRRIEKDIRLRWLVFKTEKTERMRLEGAKFLRQTKFLPDNFFFTSVLFIYSNKIVIISGQAKEFTAVVIENAEFYVMFKQFFEMLWRFVGK